MDIYANPTFYPVDASSLRTIWTQLDHSGIYMPLTYSVLAGLSSLSRLASASGPLSTPSAGLFHALSVILHLVNTTLVFFVLGKLRQRIQGGPMSPSTLHWIATSGALLFAIHPVQVESVARAGNIGIPLSTAFALATLLLYLFGFHSARSGVDRAFWYGGATVLFLCALLARPSMVALPIVAIILERAIYRSGWRAIGARTAPWIVAATLLAAILFMKQIPSSHSAVAAVWRPLIALDSLGWYAGQSLWPAKLSIDHGRTPSTVTEDPLIWVRWLVPAGFLLACAATSGTSRKVLICSGSLFFVPLLPVCGILQTPARENLSIVYDRHLYFPVIGLAFGFCYAVSRLIRDIRLVGTAVILSFCAWRTHHQIGVWKDSWALFSDVLRQNPKSWYAMGWLGTMLTESGKHGEAIALLQKAVELNPKNPDLRNNLGQALLLGGQIDRAEAELKAGLELNPKDPNVHYHLGRVAETRNQFDEAAKYYRAAVKLLPTHVLAVSALGGALLKSGAAADAEAAFRKAIALSPATADAHRGLAEIYASRQNWAEAFAEMTRACELAPQVIQWRDQLRMYERAFQSSRAQ
ncbi:MAG: tetratricopeptide repeat protein [Verrucomicrobiales bacterium]